MVGFVKCGCNMSGVGLSIPEDYTRPSPREGDLVTLLLLSVLC